MQNILFRLDVQCWHFGGIPDFKVIYMSNTFTDMGSFAVELCRLCEKASKFRKENRHGALYVKFTYIENAKNGKPIEKGEKVRCDGDWLGDISEQGEFILDKNIFAVASWYINNNVTWEEAHREVGYCVLD